MTVTQRTLNWGIIGAGEIAARAFAPGVARTPGARLTAVYTRSADKAKAFAARFHVPLVEPLRHVQNLPLALQISAIGRVKI